METSGHFKKLVPDTRSTNFNGPTKAEWGIKLLNFDTAKCKHWISGLVNTTGSSQGDCYSVAWMKKYFYISAATYERLCWLFRFTNDAQNKACSTAVKGDGIAICQ